MAAEMHANDFVSEIKLGDKVYKLNENLDYKRPSHTNYLIKTMSISEVRRCLSDVALDTSGDCHILRKRLKTYYEDIRFLECNLLTLEKLNISQTPKWVAAPVYDYYCIIDFEATCERDTQDYLHEIIEFPIVVVDGRSGKVVDEYHSYCRPQVNKVLTDFCVELTGISQEVVDLDGKSFEDVLGEVELFLARFKHKRQPEINGNDENIDESWTRYIVVTDGPWDMEKFMRIQCSLLDIRIPDFAKEWINLRKTFRNFYRRREGQWTLNLDSMLTSLGLTFEGRPHSGLDDARNIARIASKLLQDGARLKRNEQYNFNKKSSRRQEGPVDGSS